MLPTIKKSKRHLYDWPGVEPYTLFSDTEIRFRLGRLSALSSLGVDETIATFDADIPWITLEDLEKPLNTSVFYPNYQRFLDASSSNDIIEEEHFEEFDEAKSKALRDSIEKTRFEPGEDNTATLMFAELLANEQIKDAVLKYIQGLFIEMYESGNVGVCVKILTMLGFYSYKELFPFSQAIALASVSNKSTRVTSAAINLFAHWGNKEALSLMKNIAEPLEPWIKMKYLSVKKSLEEKCSILEK